MSNTSKNILLENKKKLLKETFQLMDSDSDGYLDYHETKYALKALGLRVNKSFVLSLIRMYNRYDNNKICFDDFYYVVLKKLKEQSISDEIKYVFKLFLEGSAHDSITFEDLQRINEKLNCNLTTEEMKLMILEFDLDHDGSINETEFLEMMTGTEI